VCYVGSWKRRVAYIIERVEEEEDKEEEEAEG